jgi:hypothetical protein
MSEKNSQETPTDLSGGAVEKFQATCVGCLPTCLRYT